MTTNPPAAAAATHHLPSVRGHMPALDGVRGLAVLGVLLLHFIGAMEPQDGLERAIVTVTKYGSYGVELFFVLSGFLITGILVDARAKPAYFRNFYARRTLRIFPLYYFVLGLVFFGAPLVPQLRGPTLDFLTAHQAWAWLYGVNIFIARHGEWSFSYLDHFWSLSVEEHFYFFWPLVVYLLAPRPRLLLRVALSTSLAAMAARLIGSALGLSWWTTYVFTPFRLDGLALGAFLAVAARQPAGLVGLVRVLPRTVALAGTGLLATFAWTKLAGKEDLALVLPVRASLILVLLACLLLKALVSPDGSRLSRFFMHPWMIFLGTYSYGIYVYHHFISYYLATARTEHPLGAWLGSHLGAVLVQTVLGLSVSMLVAYASYHLVEKRFLGLKRYFA